MYLVNSTLKTNKNIYSSLTGVFGVGFKISRHLVKKLGFCKNLKFYLLSDKQLFKLKKTINLFIFFLANNLKKILTINFKKALKLKLIKAIRKLNGLPIRGQRTKTNARTAKRVLKFF